MKELGVYFKQWKDDENGEIGILIKHSYGLVMDVGDFSYEFSLDLSEWEYLGPL